MLAFDFMISCDTKGGPCGFWNIENVETRNWKTNMATSSWLRKLNFDSFSFFQILEICGNCLNIRLKKE
jgi:hypothetical protein